MSLIASYQQLARGESTWKVGESNEKEGRIDWQGERNQQGAIEWQGAGVEQGGWGNV
jgi:hypothetical protein